MRPPSGRRCDAHLDLDKARHAAHAWRARLTQRAEVRESRRDECVAAEQNRSSDEIEAANDDAIRAPRRRFAGAPSGTTRLARILGSARSANGMILDVMTKPLPAGAMSIMPLAVSPPASDELPLCRRSCRLRSFSLPRADHARYDAARCGVHAAR